MARRNEANVPITAQNKTDRAFGEVKANLKGMQKLAFSTKAAFSGIAGTLALGLISKQVLDVVTSFEKLKASLTTVTGSEGLSASAFEQIQTFAKETPFALEEVTRSFIKLKALGLDPSERAMRSYGNTASAMAKSLDQMVEAVADATTGEFERLKEFGIKARSQGDKVTFTFRGVATTIDKESRAIQEFLLRIGEVDFAGGMERQANTLGGSINNLGDSWDNLLASFGETTNLRGAQSLIAGLSNQLEILSLNLAPTGQITFNKLIAEREELKADIANANFLRNTRPLERRLAIVNASIKELSDAKTKLQQEESKAERLAGIAAEEQKKAALAIKDAAAAKIWMKDAQKELNKELKAEALIMREAEQLRKSLLHPIEAYNEELERLNFLLKETQISEETFARGVSKAGADYRAATEDIKKDTESLEELWEDLGLTFSSAFEDAIVEGDTLREVLKGLEQDILRITTRELVTKPFANIISSFAKDLASGSSKTASAPSGGGFLSFIDDIASDLFGFANGGKFVVGGAGGTDSQLVAFRASPNEEVSIKTPSQVANNSSGFTQITQIIQITNTNSRPIDGRTVTQVGNAAYNGGLQASQRNG